MGSADGDGGDTHPHSFDWSPPGILIHGVDDPWGDGLPIRVPTIRPHVPLYSNGVAKNSSASSRLLKQFVRYRIRVDHSYDAQIPQFSVPHEFRLAHNRQAGQATREPS